jgi:N-acetylmuramic acid 6-phosphate etherase
MKSGTAQKLILNMISTAAMIRLGKVYKNLMVDLRPVNQKLILRSLKLIREVTGCPAEEAETAFAAAGKNSKIAMVMILLKVSPQRAEELLREADGHISRLTAPVAAPLAASAPAEPVRS